MNAKHPAALGAGHCLTKGFIQKGNAAVLKLRVYAIARLLYWRYNSRGEAGSKASCNANKINSRHI